MKIILLSGFAGAGKDTVASILVKQKGYTRFAFADPIKEEMATELNLPVDVFHTVEGKRRVVNGKTLRQYCIDHGERRRSEDPEYWVKETAKRILQSDQEKIVISDWRLLPELFGLQKAFPDAQFIPIRIEKSQQYVSSVPDYTEYGLLGFPFATTIHNCGIYFDGLVERINNIQLW
jgi:dephospho-CoA kinase